MKYPITMAFTVVRNIKKNQKHLLKNFRPASAHNLRIPNKNELGKIIPATGHSLEQMSLQH